MIIFALFIPHPGSTVEIFVKMNTEDYVPGQSPDYYYGQAMKELERQTGLPADACGWVGLGSRRDEIAVKRIVPGIRKVERSKDPFLLFPSGQVSFPAGQVSK